MPFEHYIPCGAGRLRCGYTTGTCAALAAAGAARLLLTGAAPKTMALTTPAGIPVEAELLDARLDGGSACCAVRKDGGDDIDATDGLLVYAAVRKTAGGITIDGGEGVGRVTAPGLDQPVGAAAINTTPRRMIAQAAAEQCRACGWGGGLAVTVSIPGGAETAAGTFNPRLGILGGLSVLGTTGIVEPRSLRALLDTVEAELKMYAAAGRTDLILTPGHYGEEFLRTLPGLDGVPVVQYANFLGDSLDLAARHGFRRVLVAGHLGKLVKAAGGIMDTHSRVADCRMEILTAHAALCGAGQDCAAQVMAAVTTDQALEVLDRFGLREAVLHSLLPRLQDHLEHRAAGAFRVGAVVFNNVSGLLGATGPGAALLKELGGIDL